MGWNFFKSKKKFISLLSVLMFSISFFPVGVGAVTLEDGNMVGEQYEEVETPREKINFNREWKFIRSDVENADEPKFDDSEWTDIGLPHNFSIPYNMESNFYVGYGWYRKTFEVPENWEGKQVNIEFEGAFQVAEVFVNGEYVGMHEGGYTGFTFDITNYVNPGENLIAIRVNNIWQPDLAPRAGDHQFTGGIYRDVYLNVTDPVHVTWYGTFVNTPDLTNPGFDPSAKNVLDYYTSEEDIKENIKNKRSNVNVKTEVKNESKTAKKVKVKQQVVDEDNKIVSEFYSPEETIEPGQIHNFDDVSEQIKGINIWDTENPYLYKVYTTVYTDNVPVDTYESPLGFRWAEYKNDGFYLNGEKILLDGANVHQDHGGWADAVTNEGFSRDVSMIKESGMNFIRGSHYPHDPSFAEACDEQGVLFWSEAVFWGMGGCDGKDAPSTLSAEDWFKDAYPQNPEDEANFEASCKRALAEMIRVNRNHPSIINWSMGNEVFFTSSKTQAKAKNLVNEMRNLSHELDPTRKAAMGGVQRQGYDSLEVCDIAGYNGDGGRITNLTMPNVVAEYGSQTADRPGNYRPYYNDIAVPGTTDEYRLTENSAGLTLWCAFHHGTIGGAGLAKMGMIDYYRLPLNTWYWYREDKTGVAPESSKVGEATQIKLERSNEEMKNDGTSDNQLIVTMVDDEGNWVNDSKNVTLQVVDGPGVFPTGKTYEFKVGDTMRDGKAAIEFRSFFSGETTIIATAGGLPETEIKITTTNVSGEFEGEEPENFMVTPESEDTTEKIEEPNKYGANNVASGRPAFPSSNNEDKVLALDGDIETSWVADNAGSGEYWMIDLEFAQYLYKLKLGFNESPYAYKIEVSTNKEEGPWTTVVDYTNETVNKRPVEESVDGLEARFIKVTFTDVPEDQKAFLSEFEVYGVTASQSPQYVSESVYLSDLEWDSIKNGWGKAGKDESCEGNPIRVGGKTYEKGLGFHASSEVVYNLDGKYSRFQTVAGIDNEVSGGNAIFKIFADNILIYEKELSGGDSDIVDVSVSNVKKLRLVTDKNGADSQDHTDWADAKLLGAIRDISKDDSTHKASFTSNTQELKGGKNFEAIIGLTNETNSKTGYSASLALYNEKNELVDIVMVKDYLAKGKSTSFNLNMKTPANISGHYAKLNIWETNTLMPLVKTTYVGSEINNEAQTKNLSDELVWTKVDGEDMDKVGNWKMWGASSAYMETETYTGDADTPLTPDVSISYSFEGTNVSVTSKCDGSQVGADVYIDNEKVGTINSNTTASGVNEYREVWSSDNLSAGNHTIKLVPIGKFGLDYIQYAKTPEEIVNNKVELKAAFKEVLSIVEGGQSYKYTEESTKALGNSNYEGYGIYKKNSATQNEIDAATESILNAINGLEEIATVDKSQLIKLIEDSKALIINAEEGFNVGQYHKGAKENLQVVINSAEEVLSRANIVQEDIDKSIEELNNAIAKFKLLKIEELTGDFNNNGKIDIGDLSLVSKDYGSDKLDFDVNKDGTIDKYDIEFIQYRILN
ncbi:MAG: NPCBM/NEW2 domain-containing protein [Clostridium sp.]